MKESRGPRHGRSHEGRKGDNLLQKRRIESLNPPIRKMIVTFAAIGGSPSGSAWSALCKQRITTLSLNVKNRCFDNAGILIAHGPTKSPISPIVTPKSNQTRNDI